MRMVKMPDSRNFLAGCFPSPTCFRVVLTNGMPVGKNDVIGCQLALKLVWTKKSDTNKVVLPGKLIVRIEQESLRHCNPGAWFLFLRAIKFC